MGSANCLEWSPKIKSRLFSLIIITLQTRFGRSGYDLRLTTNIDIFLFFKRSAVHLCPVSTRRLRVFEAVPFHLSRSRLWQKLRSRCLAQSGGDWRCACPSRPAILHSSSADAIGLIHLPIVFSPRIIFVVVPLTSISLFTPNLTVSLIPQIHSLHVFHIS